VKLERGNRWLNFIIGMSMMIMMMMMMMMMMILMKIKAYI